eukprot:365895-Chlamydomonas_euryale.AAC.13
MPQQSSVELPPFQCGGSCLCIPRTSSMHSCEKTDETADDRREHRHQGARSTDIKRQRAQTSRGNEHRHPGARSTDIKGQGATDVMGQGAQTSRGKGPQTSWGKGARLSSARGSSLHIQQHAAAPAPVVVGWHMAVGFGVEAVDDAVPPQCIHGGLACVDHAVGDLLGAAQYHTTPHTP